MERKFCKDCRHYVAERITERCRDIELCGHPKARNIVTAKATYASTMRRGYMCSESAKLFEAIEADA